MAIREGYEINNINRLLENKYQNSDYKELEVENEYTEKLIELGSELSGEIKFITLESQKFDTWSEYYSLFAISKSNCLILSFISCLLFSISSIDFKILFLFASIS